MTADDTRLVLDDLMTERDRQNIKWGEQNHPDGTGGHIPYWGFVGPADCLARLMARSHGWSTTGVGHDLCPACRASANDESTAPAGGGTDG